jgi:outer membrane receptor protein involved in Fe transport
VNPAIFGLGDLFETTNTETAAGVTARFHSAPIHFGHVAELVAEPGIYVRGGHTDQSKSLLDPTTLNAWDRRLDDGLQTLDVGAYLDLDLRILRRFRLSGGLRADLLTESILDRLANVVPAGSAPPGALPGTRRDVAGVAAGPRITAEYSFTPGFAMSASYGEGFRSLDAASLHEGASSPYSKVRSVEAGLRAEGARKRLASTLAIFETWVGNEVVFEATTGGLET